MTESPLSRANQKFLFLSSKIDKTVLFINPLFLFRISNLSDIKLYFISPEPTVPIRILLSDEICDENIFKSSKLSKSVLHFETILLLILNKPSFCVKTTNSSLTLNISTKGLSLKNLLVVNGVTEPSLTVNIPWSGMWKNRDLSISKELDIAPPGLNTLISSLILSTKIILDKDLKTTQFSSSWISQNSSSSRTLKLNLSGIEE